MRTKFNWDDERRARIAAEQEKIRLTGPPRAPWEMYPGRGPYGGWNQGTQGYFLDFVFLPWWRDRSSAEREEYLEQHEASEEWREYLRW